MGRPVYLRLGPEMQKFYIFLVVICSTIAFLIGLDVIKPVLASVYCVTQYGGGQNCTTTQLTVNKTVWNPDSKSYVDNLTLANHRFQNGDEVDFKVDITNSGSLTLTGITFTDMLPANLVWSGGDSLTSTIGSLDPGQTITKYIKTKVTGVNYLICEINTAIANSDQGNSSDTSQACMGQGEVKATQTPATGPEMLIWAVLPSIGGLGYFLKRKGGEKE